MKMARNRNQKFKTGPTANLKLKVVVAVAAKVLSYRMTHLQMMRARFLQIKHRPLYLERNRLAWLDFKA